LKHYRRGFISRQARLPKNHQGVRGFWQVVLVAHNHFLSYLTFCPVKGFNHQWRLQWEPVLRQTQKRKALRK
jgi:hypothetical protein